MGKMDVKYKQNYKNLMLESIFQTKFYVENSQTYLKYCYLLQENKSKRLYWDREQIRKFNFKKYQTNDKNYFCIYDYEFKRNFNFNRINDYFQ